MNGVNVVTGAILDSRRDGVQVHASHFSRPPSLTVAEGGLYSCLLLEDCQDEISGGLRCSCGLRAHGSCPFPLRASGAVWLEALVLAAASGRGETSPTYGTS